MATEILSDEFLIQASGKTIARSTDFTLNDNGSPIEITNFDSAGWKEFVMGLQDWSVDVNGLVVRSGTSISGMTSYDTLKAAKKAKTPITIAIKATVTGDKYESGTGYITKISTSYKLGDKATYSISIQGTGSLSTLTL